MIFNGFIGNLTRHSLVLTTQLWRIHCAMNL